MTPSDAAIIEQLKQQLDATTRQLDVTSQRLQLSELRVQLLEDKLRQQRIAKYGPGSEKFSDAQLELLELEPGVSSAEVQAESERPPQCGSRHLRVPGRKFLMTKRPQPLEFANVQLLISDVEHVPGRTRQEPGRLPVRLGSKGPS